jgi:RNA processing factor Prp31
LAAKCSLCIRVDALGEDEEGEIGTECKEYVEKRVAYLENTSNA